MPKRIFCQAWLVAGLALTACAAEDGLRSVLRPGQVLTYEFEGHFGFVPDRVALRYETDFNASYRGPAVCDYYYSTLIELRFFDQTPGKGLTGAARYLNPRLTQWQCPDLDRKKAEEGLAALSATVMPFSINDRGEITVPPLTEEQLDFRGTFRLLVSSTMDLLHPILARGPVAAGGEWKPRENFIYWKEYVDSGLETSASTAKYIRDVRIAGDSCAQLDFKYVLAPQDLAASASTAEGSVRVEYAGSISTGLLQVSALFDRTAGHVAWAHRYREIDNRLYLGHDDAGSTRTLTHFKVTEESTVRELRQGSPLEWSSALRNFESSGGTPAAPAAGDSNPLMRAAAEARARRRAGQGETPQLAPPGFVRYEKRLCSNSWSCSVVSIALPGSVETDDDSPMRVTFLATTGKSVASISIGPNQEKISRGLSDQEELRKSALAFLTGKMWLRAGPGTPVIMSDTYIGDYPALLTDFKTSRIDGVQMEGRLASVLTAWGEIVSVGCGYAKTDALTEENICRQVLDSVRVHQIEP
ncbi:MAG TPA: hypothetical protein VKW06_10735 [Candidatus Angelobacter sp.]|nr:hypothetical protein [Candidatus Angelobacter sp.]